MALIRGKALLLAAASLLAAESRLRPPLTVDPDDRHVGEPLAEQKVSEIYAILYNSWLRHLSPEAKALAARDHGALNVNAWDEVPDSTWFTNRMGRHPLEFDEILRGLKGNPPQPGGWKITKTRDEGYTPKFDIKDGFGQKYILKFDLPAGPERNSGAERISTLIMHAAGYHVPHNSIVYFRAADLALDPKAQYEHLKKKRKMTPGDVDAMLAKLKPLADGRYRGLASCFLDGVPVGQFTYTGVRKDDPNDLIPHELRRELRGLRVIAAWINHVDAGDKNTQDMLVAVDGRKFVRHHLLDFGSTLGSGDFVNGPWRVGHEYIFDGAAMGRAFVTFGAWRRPWEMQGKIPFTEVGYYAAELFEPANWKPNYPNLAFERMDDSDAYWGAKIVTGFSDETIERLAEEGQYSRREATLYVASVLKQRRDLIGRYWLERITPLEEFALDGGRLRFRDLAVERGYAEAAARRYRIDGGQPVNSTGGCDLPAMAQPNSGARPDRYGRTVLQRVRIQSNRRDGGWALPVEVFLGRNGEGQTLEVLGWEHAPR